MADTIEPTKKKRRRGKRGSEKGLKLEDEISKLVHNEVQKYGNQLKKLAEIQYAANKPRPTAAEKPKAKCWKAEVRSKIKAKKSTVKTNNPPVSKKGQLHNHKSENIPDKSMQGNVKMIEDNIRARLTEKILKDISKMSLKTPVIQNTPQISPGNAPSFPFPKSINRVRMSEMLNGQAKFTQQYIPGILKVNNKNPKYSYVCTGDDKEDFLIDGYCDRNRAMENDLVVIQIYPRDRWTQKANGSVQKTGFIVSILEKVHPRKAIGILVFQKEVLRFHPRDSKFPVMTIDPNSLPEELKERSNIKKTLFIAKMLNWSTPFQCSGMILGRIGDVGNLEAETAAILLENNLDVSPYNEKLYKHLPGSDYILQDADLAGREDWRSNCVFTIDPATAVDLDDAISCRSLDNGNFEVGVHIADVTHFLEANSPLDQEVSKRATTIYLANTAYHMLPRALVQLCSLLPGKDRLTFSVIWELTPNGDVINHRFTRSIINSCFQMSYQQAQKMIDKADLDWSVVDLPNVQNGFTASDICQAVHALFCISKSLKSRRFASGALKINQPKIQIVLDEATKLPISYCLEERVESNELIEEFMLLANMTVASHIYKKFPNTALLRHHDPPKPQTLSRTLHPLKNLGVHLSTESAGVLQMSMSKYEQTIEKGLNYTDEQFLSDCRMMVINSLCAQAMVRANYICSGSAMKKSSLRHYALNVPLYTHFTSPIRRYADCLVHRLLASDLEGTPLPTRWTPEYCADRAKNCNRMKDRATSAQEKSNEIYFTHLIAHNGASEQLAIVMAVRQHSLDVILCHVGLTLRVELSETQNHATVEYSNDDSVETIRIDWKEPQVTQFINVFAIIHVRVRKHPKVYCIQTSLLPPKVHY